LAAPTFASRHLLRVTCFASFGFAVICCASFAARHLASPSFIVIDYLTIE